MNITIAQSIVLTIMGRTDLEEESDNGNCFCDENTFDEFLQCIVRMVPDPSPASRHSTGIWLLALVKSCSKKPSIYKNIDVLQYAFTELLSDESGK